ncbi:MAG: polysaccharide biosynthesis protein [Actinobacteria bacterium]|nr:polysaccharide biosynthesis protein [Actinomycetota bacterium]
MGRGWMAPTGRKRTGFFLAADLGVFVVAMYGAFLLRFDGRIPDGVPASEANYLGVIPVFLALAVVPKVVSNAAFRLYNVTWRFVGTRDILNVILATVVGSLAWGMGAYFLRGVIHVPPLPRSILALDFLITLMGVGGVRMAKRVYQVVTQSGRAQGQRRRVLVVGGGRAGEKLVREMTHSRVGGYWPVGVIDDNKNIQGTYLHGVRILGGRELIPTIVKDERVDTVIVAMPSAPGQVIREVVMAARAAGCPAVQILPGVTSLLEGRIVLQSVREVKVEDLLGREPVVLDIKAMGNLLYGRTVLVTGAAGSIGSELVRQIASFEPGRLVLLEKDETRLFGLELELRRTAPRVPAFPVVADVRDRERMRQVFITHQPQVVFHAAAYKHVPMMEAHPQEAVVTNILGTRVMAEVSAEQGVDIFVQISTDKAVNPTSVMGATKRVAEMVVRRLNETTATRFLAVRFGNVLGSRGSLIPILEEQIQRGGPITVTDPAMERYFMTVTEAVRLILKAASLGQGGEVFVLDMGQPVRIMDLAEALIRLSGLEPDVDVPIQFTGARPGEKLKEEILMAEEGLLTTQSEKIFVARLGNEPDPEALEQGVDLLIEAAGRGEPARIRALLQDTVKTYRPEPGAEGDELLAELLDAPPEGASG